MVKKGFVVLFLVVIISLALVVSAANDTEVNKSKLNSSNMSNQSNKNVTAASAVVEASSPGFFASVSLFVGRLPLWVKAGAVILIILAIIMIIRAFGDNPANNFRKAGKLHQEAFELHQEGEEEDAKMLFEKANYYREKAYEQQKK